VYKQPSVVAESDDRGIPPPDYNDGIYLSERCRPGAGEQALLHALSQRSQITVHDAALAINQAAAADSVEDFIRVSMLYETLQRYSEFYSVFTVLIVLVLMIHHSSMLYIFC